MQCLGIEDPHSSLLFDDVIIFPLAAKKIYLLASPNSRVSSPRAGNFSVITTELRSVLRLYDFPTKGRNNFVLGSTFAEPFCLALDGQLDDVHVRTCQTSAGVITPPDVTLAIDDGQGVM